jgi:hypothetical protein
MKLTAFRENDPWSLSEFPFDDMYTEDKFIKIGKRDDIWLGVLTTIDSYEGEILVESISEYTDFQTGYPVTKSGIISRIYNKDEESKILRDSAAGRNLDKFAEYDAFVESIPSI